MSEAHGALESTNSSSVNLVVDVVGERTHFQGELVRYTVVLTNPTTASITLSWCSAHLHCRCKSSRKLRLNEIVAETNSRPLQASSAAAFTPTKGDKGVVLFETDATVLCCDTTIQPGDNHAVTYEAKLPSDVPPSYRGERVTCSYKLSLACRRESAAAAIGQMEVREAAVGCELFSRVAEEIALQNTLGPSDVDFDASLDFATNDLIDTIEIASPNTGRDSPEIHYRVATSDKGHTSSDGTTSGLTISTDYENGDSPARVDSAAPPKNVQGISTFDTAVTAAAHDSEDNGEIAAKEVGPPTRSALMDCQGEAPMKLRNPYAAMSLPGLYERERVLYAISSLARRRKPSAFKIAAGDTTVVKLYLTKPVFRIGEDVVGWLDFAEATVPCYQVIMALETEEEIPRKYWKSAEIATPHFCDQIQKTVECQHMPMVPIMLPVPVLCAPQFSTSIVSVKWKLTFKFFVGEAEQTMVSDRPTGTDDTITSAPRKISTRMLSWGLPISILPSNPSNCPPA